MLKFLRNIISILFLFTLLPLSIVNADPTQYTLTISTSGSGDTSGAGLYDSGSIVNVTATPATGWKFDNWTGDVADSNAAITTVTMDADKTITANFSELPMVTLTMAGSGSGTTNPIAGTHSYSQGTVINISATPATGWKFDNWTGDVVDSNAASTTVTMDAAKTITANFSQIPTVNMTLTMSVSGSGTTNPTAGNHSYSQGTVVNISATPATSWKFDNWTGDVADSNAAITTVTMDADKTITANFLQISTVTLTMAVSGEGTVSPTAGNYSYTKGQVVEITAIPASGWKFSGWSGVVADADSTTTTVTMDVDKTLTAVFAIQEDHVGPVISSLKPSNVGKTEVDIAWTTDVSSTSQVEYWASPSVFTPVDENMVTEHTVHLTGLIPATLYHYRTISIDAAGNATTSLEGAFTTLGVPATFITSDPEFTKTTIDGGEKIDISILVTNSGDQPGNYEATLTVNDIEELTQRITLEAGASQKMDFTITKKAIGVYTLNVSGFTYTFVVEQQGSGSMGWLIYIGIAMGIVLILVVVFLWMRRNRLSNRTTTTVNAEVTEKPDKIQSASPISSAKPARGNTITDNNNDKGSSQAQKPLKQPEPRGARRKIKKATGQSVKPKTESEMEKTTTKAETVGKQEPAELNSDAPVKKVFAVTKPETEAKRELAAPSPVEPPNTTKGLNFTPEAVEKLRELKNTLQSTTNPDMCYRMIFQVGDSQKLLLVLDKEQDDDQTLEMDGEGIVILAPDVVKALDGVVIDYRRTTTGAGFVVILSSE